ncbi:capsule assembly Wzi family protein, partial [Roseisolibacter sp. H3M3-2]|uniref:capsule assembly Wzi family protein n=1 Tax=Roseisolibacter sp. H3M3-2 TaxID=3031323 RepID=UPI0023DAA6DD
DPIHASSPGAAALLLAGPVAVSAQPRPAADSPPRRVTPAGPAWIGSPAELRARDAQLLEGRSTAGFLLRSSSTALRPPSASGRLAVRVLAPSVRVAQNSDIPLSLNDGAMWAGRGTSLLARAGVEARLGPLRAVFAPEVAYAANRPFDFIPVRRPDRSPFASPWQVGASSIDLPSRFGDRSYARVTPGQSSVAVRVGALDVGGATENSVWGPGRWSALTLSANAEGFPHAFVRTARPLRTRLGDVEARYLIGALTPSVFFDSAVTRQYRSFSGAAVTLRPAAARGLTLGLTRAVIATVGDRSSEALGHTLDALFRWQAPPDTAGGPMAADQLTGAFGRWVFADDHVEVYGEWARQTTPRSVGELLAAPQEGAAITLGARALRPLGRRTTPDRYLRFELELTSTEQSIAFRDRPLPAPFYAGRATREGFTQRGQALGAAVGPGASAQWLATDYVTRDGSFGLGLARVRWFNDALYQQVAPNFFRHDVSTLLTARATRRLPLVDVQGEATWERRYNYLFQNGIANPGGRRTVDVGNLTFVLGVTPR